MKPFVTGDWEIHGPHPGMPYEVYTGPAKYLPESGYEGEVCVVIYHHTGKVYEIDDNDDWWKATEENRIPVIRLSKISEKRKHTA